MKKLLPILLVLLGVVAGAGAGMFLHPAAEQSAETADAHDAEAAADGAHAEAPPAEGHDHGASAEGGHEYVKLNNQFIVPLIENGEMAAMVLLSLSLEVTAGSKETVFAVEPRLRDTYLRVMFDHANAGGFDGAYTDRSKLDVLRATLAEVTRPLLGERIIDVLIEEIVRQDSR